MSSNVRGWRGIVRLARGACGATVLGLAGCGGGGGSPAEPAPRDPGAQPGYVDTANYASLDAHPAAMLITAGETRAIYPRLLASTGVWADADVSADLSMDVAISGVTNPSSLPSSLTLTMTMAGLNYNIYSSHRLAFGPASQTLTASAHPVAGWSLRRFASGAMPAGVSLCSAVLDAGAIGVKYARPVYWKYRDGSVTGQARGAHVLGMQTTRQAQATQPSAVYQGVMIGTVASAMEGVSWAFDEVSGRIEVQYDAASKTVTFKPSGALDYQMNNCLINGLFKKDSPTPLSLAWSSLTCLASVDASTGAVRCEVDVPVGNMTVVFRGHFYGPEAREFAGTVHFIGSFNASNYDNEGVTGAFVTTKAPLVP